jgi:hypothetical protein
VYDAGTAAMAVVPQFAGVEAAIRKQAQAWGITAGEAFGNSFNDKVKDQTGGPKGAPLGPSKQRSQRQGQESGGSFADGFRKRVEAALKNLPPITIGVARNEAEQQLRDLQAQLRTLAGKTVGVDIDAADAVAEVQRIQQQLDDLGRSTPDVQVRADAASASAQLAAIAAQVEALNRQPAEVKVEVDGDRFSSSLRTSLGAALRALPAARITADSSDADRQLADIRAKMDALSSKRIGVDVDAASAFAQVRALQARLSELASKSPDIRVRVNAGAAAGQLAAVSDGVDNVGGSASLASGRLATLIGIGAAIGPAIIPVAAAAAAAIGAMGVAAGAAVAGIGVGILGFSGVGNAVQALDAAQKDAGKSAASLSSAQNSVASAADGVRSAERSLANTRSQVAESNRRAAQQVTDAERELTQAQRDARSVVLELDAARQQASRRLTDLNANVKENALSQRQANLDVAEAKRALDKVLSDPKATVEQREQAQITYDRQVLQQEDLQRRGKELAADAKAANKAGVEGSREVLAARDRISQANQRVVEAERGVAEARRNQQQQQVQGAFQIAQATQAVTAAQRSLQQASVQAGVAGSASADKLREAMEGLSPAGQRFARFLFGLKDEFRSLRAAAAEGLLPGVQSAIQSVLPMLPQLERFVGAVATKMGELAVRAAAALKDPFWQDFFALIGREAVPSLERLFQIAGNVAKGFAGILSAFAPLNAEVGDGLVGLTQKFADFGAGLSTSTGFQEFLDYVRTNGPVVADLIGNLATLAGKLVVGLAPLGAGTLGGINLLVGALAGLSPDTLAKIAIGISAISAAMAVYNIGTKAAALATGLWTAAQKVASAATKIWTGIQWLFNAALVANPIGIAVVAVLALGAAVVVAYNKSETFRNIVQAAWAGIRNAVSVAWTDYIRPALVALGDFFTNRIAPAALWLWRNVLVPAFEGISAAVSFAWNSIIKPVFAGLVWWFRDVIAPAALWLWRNVIMPAWQGIQLAISVAWAAIQVVFGLIKIGVKILGAAFTFWKDNVILPVFNFVKNLIATWWSGIQIIFNAVRSHIQSILGPVFTWLKDRVIVPVWAGIKSTISTAWLGIKTIFTTLGGFLSTHVVPVFKRGVEAIGKAWKGIQEAAKAPVKFVVQSVLNNGLLAGYNKIAKLFDVKPDNVQIPLPKGFAAGGVLPGYTPGRDVHRFVSPSGGVLDLSGGEAVIRPEGTRALGRGWVDGINSAARSGGVGGVRRYLGRFASGGFIDDLTGIYARVQNTAASVIGGVKDFATDPAGTLKQLAGRLLGLLPGRNTSFGQTLTAVANRVLGGLTSKLTGFLSGGSTDWPASPGAQRGDSGVWRRVLATIKSTGPASGEFGNAYRPGDPKWHGSGRAVDWMGYNQDKLATFLAGLKPLELIHRTKNRDYAYTRGRNKGSFNEDLMDAHRNHIHVAMKSGGVLPWLAPMSFDQGGWLPDTRSMPGQAMQVYHGRRQPDAVLTHQQWATMRAAATRGGGTFEGTLVLEDGSFLGRVRGEMERVADRMAGQLADSLIYSTS